MGVRTILKGHELFRHLSMDEVEKISGFSERREYDQGDVIFRVGDKAEKVYILLEGEVHLHLRAGQEEFRIVVAKVEKEDLFGISPLLASERYILEAQCTKDSEVLVVEAKKFRKLLETDSATGVLIMTEVARVYYERYVEVLNRLQSIVSQLPLIA